MRAIATRLPRVLGDAVKHTFESVLPLFVAALGEPSHKLDADEVRELRSRGAWWHFTNDRHRNTITLTITDEDDVLCVLASAGIDPAGSGLIVAGWDLNADDAEETGDPVATPEEAPRLACEWAKVPA